VTGTSGFLGGRIVNGLIKREAFVVGIDNSSGPLKGSSQDQANDNFCFLRGDFNERANEALTKLRSAGRKSYAVFHMAGIADRAICEREPVRAFESNVMLTTYVLDFCRENGIAKFIFPSTALVYGDRLESPATENDVTNPVNVYAATKLSAETMIDCYSRQFGIKPVIARLSNVYGPGSTERTVIGRILSQVKKSEPIEVSDLMPVRDYLYVDDAVEGLIRLLVLVNAKSCHIFNLSTGIGSSVLTLVKTICKELSITDGITNTSRCSSISKSTLVLNNEYLLKVIGWKPKYTLAEGIRKILKEDCVI